MSLTPDSEHRPLEAQSSQCSYDLHSSQATSLFGLHCSLISYNPAQEIYSPAESNKIGPNQNRFSAATENENLANFKPFHFLHRGFQVGREE
jgi:hypothetical protein